MNHSYIINMTNEFTFSTSFWHVFHRVAVLQTPEKFT